MSSGTRAAVRDARVTELEAQLLQLAGREHKAERSKVNRELWVLQQPTQPAPLMQPARTTTTGGDDLVAPFTPMQQPMTHWQLLHPTSEAGSALCVRCGEGGAPTCRFRPDARAFAFGTGRFGYGYTSLWDTPHDRWFCCGGIGPECAGCCEEQKRRMSKGVVKGPPSWWWHYAHCPRRVEMAPLQSHGCATHSGSLRTHMRGYGTALRPSQNSPISWLSTHRSHRTDPHWWSAYDHLSPALASDWDSSSDSSSEGSFDGAEAMSAMDIT